MSPTLDVIPGGLGAFAIIVAAIVAVLILVLVWLLSRDKNTSRTSFGFYVERRRFEEEPVWVEPEEQKTLPWPAVAPNLPPKEEP